MFASITIQQRPPRIIIIFSISLQKLEGYGRREDHRNNSAHKVLTAPKPEKLVDISL